MAEEGHKVTLNVYDLSQGLAKQMSMALLGKPIEGIWHTGIVVYGNEYYFGGGIQHTPAGSTQYGAPIRVVDLGVTHVPKDVFEMYLQEISPRYTAETYSLLTHNCNNFSNELAQFLVGANIPDFILQLPNEVMSSPMAPIIMPMIQGLEDTMKQGGVPQIPRYREVERPAKIIRPDFGDLDKDFREKSKLGGQQSSNSEELPSNYAAIHRSGVIDPLGDARSKVQEEITAEFAAIMASGTLRASEAAALATRRVMQRYGPANPTLSQS